LSVGAPNDAAILYCDRMGEKKGGNILLHKSLNRMTGPGEEQRIISNSDEFGKGEREG